MNKINQKVVIITGASSGIGLACVHEFYSKGAKVVLAARNYDTIKAIEEELNSNQSEKRALAVKADVTVEADCKNLIEKAIETFGKIDILVNNAGLSMRANFADVDLNVLKKLMDVNFWGTAYCTKHALPHLIASKGSIVGVSSVAGMHGLPGRTGYSASKYAMQGLLDTIRIENLDKGLHVMLVYPGFVASNVRNSALLSDGSTQGSSPREEKKMMTAEQMASRILKGVQKRKRFIATSIEGKITPIIKLLFPSLLDRLYLNHMKKEPDAPI